VADDYEGIYDTDGMDDAELAELVRDRIGEHVGLDPAAIDVTARNGAVRVAGRVGSEAEYQAVTMVVTDLLGVERIRNELTIDRLSRTAYDEAADVAGTQFQADRLGRRGGADRTEDSAAHLLDDPGAEQFGTGDVGEAVERGYSYDPPRTPFQDGRDADEGR
jgi:hypothetical protein